MLGWYLRCDSPVRNHPYRARLAIRILGWPDRRSEPFLGTDRLEIQQGG